VWIAISRNRYDREWTGGGEKDKRQTGYADPDDRWRWEAEAKSLENVWLFNLYFIHVALGIHVIRVVSIPTSYVSTFNNVFTNTNTNILLNPQAARDI
jgi:hypothetical protein